MRRSDSTRGPFLALIALAVTLAMAGCGGGGSGGTPVASRGYNLAAAGRVVVLTVDAASRFTLFVQDTTSLPSGIGIQGAVSPGGQFAGQSDDATVQVTGSISPNGLTVTGTLQQNGQSLLSFQAPSVPEGPATPSQLVGSFASTGTIPALLGVDTSGHSTLWVRTAAQAGGGLMTVTADGSLQSTDGSLAGALDVSGTPCTLTLTKLDGSPVSLTIPLARVTKAHWTFLVFLNAANNLERYGPLNVNQMEKVGSTSDVNIVVQWKRATCYDCGQPDWVSTRRYYVTRDADTQTVNSLLLQDMGPNVDMGDWRELRNFIVWTQQRYPAEHYALVIWDHGAGWRNTRAAGRGLPVLPRSVSIDDSTGHEINTWELPQALGVTPRMDMVVFDASLMQMTEVAYELRNSAQYVVGSEESPPGEGYVYDTFLSDVVASPAMTPAQFSTAIVNRTLDAYGSNTNLTQSALDLSKMQAVATKLDAFADSLLVHKADSAAAEQNARNNAQRYTYADNKDLWDYADLIRTGTQATDLQAAAVGVEQAIQTAVVAERHGTINGRSHGIAVYVPDPTNYLPTYANLALARVTDWPRWLQNQP